MLATLVAKVAAVRRVARVAGGVLVCSLPLPSQPLSSERKAFSRFWWLPLSCCSFCSSGATVVGMTCPSRLPSRVRYTEHTAGVCMA